MQRCSILVFWILLILFHLLALPSAFSIDHKGRLGVGASNQFQNNLPGFSFKLQKNRSFAYGGAMAMSSSDQKGGLGIGVKAYRIFFEEPLLTFYGAVMVGFLSEKTPTIEASGFQIDLTMGSEFHFEGLQSLGLSFEFGLSTAKTDDFVIRTAGSPFLLSAIHFYL